MLDISISHPTFYSDYFEKQYYHLSKVVRDETFTWRELDELLFRLDPQNQEDIRVILDGNVSSVDYSLRYQDLDDIRHKIAPVKLQKLLKSGGTVVMNRLDLKNQAIASMCQKISDQYNLKTVSNGYLALGGNGTFGKHWDTHDVFALQLIGRKHWRVYQPTFPLPLEHQKSRHIKDSCPEIPVFDGILNAGDMLYIPRGWWHEAMPLKEEATFHLAIGAHTAKLVDYLVWIANELLPIHQLARTSAMPSTTKEDFDTFSALVAEVLNDQKNYSKFLNKVEQMRNDYSPFDLEKLVKLVAE